MFLEKVKLNGACCAACRGLKTETIVVPRVGLDAASRHKLT